MEKQNKKAVLFFAVPLLFSGALLVGAMKVVSNPVAPSQNEGEKRGIQIEKQNAVKEAKKTVAKKRVIVSNGREIAEGESTQPSVSAPSNGEKKAPLVNGGDALKEKPKTEAQLAPETKPLPQNPAPEAKAPLPMQPAPEATEPAPNKAPLLEKNAAPKKTSDVKEEIKQVEDQKPDVPESPNPDTLTKPSTPPAIPLCPAKERVSLESAQQPIILVITIQSGANGAQKPIEVKLSNETKEISPIVVPITLTLSSQKEEAKVAVQSNK